jgi:hypothetical protein
MVAALGCGADVNVPPPSDAGPCTGECWTGLHSGWCDTYGICECRSNNDCDPHNLQPCLSFDCKDGDCGEGAPIHEGGACFTPTIPKGKCLSGACVALP